MYFDMIICITVNGEKFPAVTLISIFMFTDTTKKFKLMDLLFLGYRVHRQIDTQTHRHTHTHTQPQSLTESCG